MRIPIAADLHSHNYGTSIVNKVGAKSKQKRGLFWFVMSLGNGESNTGLLSAQDESQRC